jgi:cytochrome c553
MRAGTFCLNTTARAGSRAIAQALSGNDIADVAAYYASLVHNSAMLRVGVVDGSQS